MAASAQVTLYNGAQVAPASPSVHLVMISPDGRSSDAWTAQGAYAGQPVAVFTDLSQAGTYRFGVADQVSRAPQWTSFVLAPGSSSLALPLQMGGSALTLTDQVAAQANNYQFAAGSWHYVVAWSNPTALQRDLALDIDPATLPSGWTYSFSPAGLLAGQSSILTVNTSEADASPTAQLTIRGSAGSQIVGLASKSLSRAWTMSLQASFPSYTPLSYSPATKYVTWSAPLSISVQVSGTGLPVGAVATVGLVPGSAPSTLLYGNGVCGWDDAVYQSDAGGVAVLLNAVASTALNHPLRSWYNTGWTLYENAQCVTSANGDLETFIFDVHLNNSDVLFQKNFQWLWK